MLSRETMVSTGGARLYARERGDGHPLLLLNGIGANADMWGPAENVLARGSRTVAIDCPGTGRSDTPLFPYSIPALAHLVLGALDELGHERVDVIGYSFGGLLAQEIAHVAPSRIRRLALVSTACGWGSRPPSPLAVAALATPMRYYSPDWFRLTNRLLGEDEADPTAHAAGRFANVPNPLGYAYQLCAAATWSSCGWLHRVELPSLVVSGGHDKLVPSENAVQLATLLPQSRLHLLPTASHLLIFYRGGVVAELLADFFASASVEESGAWTGGVDLHERLAA